MAAARCPCSGGRQEDDQGVFSNPEKTDAFVKSSSTE